MNLDSLAAQHGGHRNKRIIIPCSGCGTGCHPFEHDDPREPCSGCFCVKCHAEQRGGEAKVKP